MRQIIIIILGFLTLLNAQGITNTIGGHTVNDKFIIENDNGEQLLTVTGRGEVGIGVSEILHSLHVDGTVHGKFINTHKIVAMDDRGTGITDQHNVYGIWVEDGGQVGIGTTNPDAYLDIVAPDGTSALFVTNTAGVNRFALNPNSDGSWTLFDNATGSWSEGITQNSGNVGIGTTNPVGKLDVNGPIYQRGVFLHADYVFEEDYELESITEHADFMWTNKHLPSIPKASFDENGNEFVEVGSHRKGIVEELEKAHIYITQLEKRITQLEQIIIEGN